MVLSVRLTSKATRIGHEKLLPPKPKSFFQNMLAKTEKGIFCSKGKVNEWVSEQSPLITGFI